MNVVCTEIPEVVIIEPKVFGDQRGFFLESFQAGRYACLGMTRPFLQDNLSRSARGVLRGMHIQYPKPQGKLVTVLRGHVLDVAIDVRKNSPTFGKHVAVELSEENRRQLWIPRGFAHGFRVLSEVADFFYKCDEYYAPDTQKVIRWDDPELAIEWGNGRPTLSERDAEGQCLAEVADLPNYAVK